MLPKPAYLLCHKQTTSGRLRFLTLPTGVICFEGYTEGAQLKSHDDASFNQHATHWLRLAEQQLNLPSDSLQGDPEFQYCLETPLGITPLVLAVFTTIDPPFEAAEKLGGKFIPILDAKHLSTLEQNLLGLAYQHLLG